MKKLLALLLTLTMMIGLVACGAAEPEDNPEPTPEVVEKTEEPEQEPEENTTSNKLEDVTVRVGAMAGPTGMGMAKLMEDSENKVTAINIEFAELATEASAFVAPLTKGELDIACVPSNLASVIYNNTDGAVQVIATCNLGVLYVVERGDEIDQVADLTGKDIYMTGQGAVPEYTVRYILIESGINPDSDVTIHWCADTTEALSYVTKDEEAVAILPEPFVQSALGQVEDLSVAINLNNAWDALEASNSNIVTGVVVARKEFIENNPNTVREFLDEYEMSVDYINENPADASLLIEKYGIVPKAKLAEKAIPGCNLKCLTGSEMNEAVSEFLRVLYDMNPQSVGGEMPADDFYYE